MISKQEILSTAASLQQKHGTGELIAEWENMLSHQINHLMPFEIYWGKLPGLFSWLYGK